MSLVANVGYVVVELLPNSNITDGGSAVAMSNRGVVISDGGDEYDDDSFEEGVVVHFPLRVAYTLCYDGKELYAIKSENVLAVEVDD